MKYPVVIPSFGQPKALPRPSSRGRQGGFLNLRCGHTNKVGCLWGRKPLWQKVEVKGFSLLEVLIVLSIVGVILAISVPRLMKAREVTQEVACKASLQALSSTLELYYTKNQCYPDKLSDLESQGFIQKKGLLDSWGNPMKYLPVFEGKKISSYSLTSLGPDGIAGTPDDIKAEN